MTREFQNLIDNTVTLAPDRPFGAIFGTNPSKGARSPLLWRAAFESLGIDADFHAFDVSIGNISALINALKEDQRFIGGACAVPFKETLVNLVDDVDAAALQIGAVNALYRGPNRALCATNTDGAAALASLESTLGTPIAGQKAVVLGLGGAGKAVATYLAMAGATLTLWNRTSLSAMTFGRKLVDSGYNVTVVQSVDTAVLSDADVLVNCTTQGFSADSSDSPDMPLNVMLLAALPASAIVFDIIYQPPETAFLKHAAARGLRTLNGKAMNLRQAEIAFCKAFPKANPDVVAQAMAAVP